MRLVNFSAAVLLCLSTFSPLAGANAPKPSSHNATIISGQSVAHDASGARDRSPGIGWTDYLTTRTGLVEVVKRTTTGRAELHRKWMDVWHVIGGTGTLVTGGTMVDAAETGPGELRANAVSGGQTSRIAAGDLIIIPAGVPHWVKAVGSKQLVYLVVKLPVDAAR